MADARFTNLRPFRVVTAKEPPFQSITADDLLKPAFVSVGRLEIETAAGIRYATGWLAGQRTVITAAHSFAGLESQRDQVSIGFWLPGITEPIRCGWPETPINLAETLTGSIYDIAALALAHPMADRRSLPLSEPKAEEFDVTVPSFPDRSGYTYSRDTESAQRAGDYLAHWINTGEGSSGAPLIKAAFTNAPYVIGMHVEGPGLASGVGQANVALPIPFVEGFLDAVLRSWET